tara:strand:+ start:429 stop:575 length:147 start_codon:yes stop_codon:yes gene_type:complete
MEFFCKMSLIWQFIGLLAIGMIGVIVLGHLFIGFMSWRDGFGFFWWRD